MNTPYKVEYLESHVLEKNVEWKRKATIDGYYTSKDLEALILERAKQGYELFSIVPLTGSAVKSPYSVTTTIGFMVTFKMGTVSTT